ncbi:DNA replication/repair protein RecF [Leucobacter salsicius]|uniref:DNA replication/repair protein RecF n=1 Tax=Leucobacter salsicius TaxID=664638 RepID=UPI000348195E|nr:DNA replication/repair protein RecF [Leucobacter salsicius]
MRVAHLSLRDFRNYATAELPLEAGANLLVGRNGQGKTNLAEAIAYFSSLRSHRVSSDAPLVRFGEQSAFLRLKVEANARTVLLDLQINKEGPNRAQVNGNAVPPRELTRWFAAVAFVPEDLSIVRGEPSIRRRFLDDALISRHPAAAGVLQDYERVLRQRTALLKSARGRAAQIESTLPVWDGQLVSLGTQIMLARREYIADSAPHLIAAYASLVGEDHGPSCTMVETALGNVSRETSVDSVDGNVSRETVEGKFRETLAGLRQREVDRGMTLAGPHRDDLTMTLNGLPVKGYASHGESWSFALGLKLSLARVLREQSSAGDPVMILDDVFAELDGERRARLMESVSEFEQILVTAAVESDVPSDVAWHKVQVSAGSLTLDGGSE